MAEPQVIPFVIWSMATLAIALVTGFTYRAFSGRKNNAETSS